MKSAKRELLEELVYSLRHESQDWYEGASGATLVNRKSGIELWIANIPLFDTKVYRPTRIKFGLFQRITLMLAIKQCRAKIAAAAMEKIINE